MLEVTANRIDEADEKGEVSCRAIAALCPRRCNDSGNDDK